MAGRVGRVLIGLGLMLLALQLVVEATGPLFSSPAVLELLASLASDVLLEITIGAVLAIAAYSSLAVVLLVAAMASSNVVPLDVALGLVLGANLGSGLLAVLTTAKSAVPVRQVTVGNLVFKLLGVAIAAPFVGLYLREVRPYICRRDAAGGAVPPGLQRGRQHRLHRAHRLGREAGDTAAAGADRISRPCSGRSTSIPRRSRRPSLAISNAAREALHQADVVETMLIGMLKVIRDNDLRLAAELRKLDDTVDELYSAIKYYMTKISREALGEEESRRWTDIISFTINMEQIGDIIERVIIDIEDKKIKKQRNFSDAGMREIVELHERLVANLRLGMSVFLNGNVRDAQKLLEEKARFRDLERAYAGTHLERLSEQTASSIETSSLHIDLISDSSASTPTSARSPTRSSTRPARWRARACASRGSPRSSERAARRAQSVRMVQPVVLRASRSRCACCTSARA